MLRPLPLAQRSASALRIASVRHVHRTAAIAAMARSPAVVSSHALWEWRAAAASPGPALAAACRPVRCFSHATPRRSAKATLPIVTIEADASLMKQVTEEILAEAEDDDAATATTGKQTKRSAAKTKPAAKSTAAKKDKVTTAASSTSSNKHAPSAVAAPVAAASLSAGDDSAPVEWQSWDAIERPFDRPEEEAEFQKWTRILEEEESKVDRELEEEEVAAANDEMDDAERDEAEEDEMDEEEAQDKIGDEHEEEEEEEFDEIEVEPESELASPAAASLPSPPRQPKKPASYSSSRGVVSNGVRTRMLNVGGEQVMEISGVDDDEADDDADAEENEDGWDDADGELDANSEARLHALDPESQVGRGVGGVFFSRKDIMELSEKDLIESFTKGSGRGGQKLNKTNSCVHLLHLPTGTRVKCQFSRDLQANRQRARSIMKLRLEELLLGVASRTAIKAKRVRKAKDRNRRRREKKNNGGEDEEAEQEDEEVEGAEDATTAPTGSTAAAPSTPAASAASTKSTTPAAAATKKPRKKSKE